MDCLRGVFGFSDMSPSSNHKEITMLKSFRRPRSKSSPESGHPSTLTTPSSCIPMKLERMRVESKLYFPKNIINAIDSRQDAVPPQLNFSFGDYLHVLSHKDIDGVMSYEVYNPVTKQTGLVPTTCFREITKEPPAPTKPIGDAPADIACLLPPGIPVSAELLRLHKDGDEYRFHLLVHYQPDTEVRDYGKHQKRQRSHSAPPIMELSLSRKWADITALEASLADAFPVEAGRTQEIPVLPFLLPGKSPITDKNRSPFARKAAEYFSSLIAIREPREVVFLRHHMDMFLNDVMLLEGEHILRSDLVRQFFSLRPGDIILPHAEKVCGAPQSQIDDLVDATGGMTELVGICDQVWRPQHQIEAILRAQEAENTQLQPGVSGHPTERFNDASFDGQLAHNARRPDSRLKTALESASKRLKPKDKCHPTNA